jgi:hypothetical protein
LLAVPSGLTELNFGSWDGRSGLVEHDPGNGESCGRPLSAPAGCRYEEYNRQQIPSPDNVHIIGIEPDEPENNLRKLAVTEN